MKNILISFIRNNHIELQNNNALEDIDIFNVVKDSSIDRIFLLTNKDKDQSLNFKKWISERLEVEVKAVTLEKGSEKYILNKIESIIKYILLTEEGHARFFFLPGENTLQIKLWEIVNKNIYKGSIIYPVDYSANKKEFSNIEIREKRIKTKPLENKTEESSIMNKIKEVNVSEKTPIVESKLSNFEKGLKLIKTGNNIFLYGEEGTGKQTLALKILEENNTDFYSINFRGFNPAKIDEILEKIIQEIAKKDYKLYLFLNIEVLPFYLQEKLSDFKDIQIISTMNIDNISTINNLNKRFYYLLSSSVIPIEPLRKRKDEISVLVNLIIKERNYNVVLSDNAKSIMQKHNWPGNFNELHSVLSRACSETDSIITSEIIEQAMDRLEHDLDKWQNTIIDENFNLNDTLGEVAMHYIMLALEMAEGKKLKASRLLGFTNYQTLSNWIKKYGK